MAQPVDPFIPISARPIRFQKRPLPQPVSRINNGKFGADVLPPTKPHAVPIRQLSSGTHAGTHEQPVATPAPRTANRIHPQSTQTRPSSPARKTRPILYYLKLLAACIVTLAVGSLAQVAVAGEILIGMYAVWALVKRIPSRTTFLLALGTFAAIAGLLIIKPDQVLMRNFATYAFLFLLVGAISLAREARD